MLNLGVYTLYNPSATEFKIFNNWLWGNNSLDRLWTDPISLIVGVYLSPIKPSNLSPTSSDIYIGGKKTDGEAKIVTNEYETIYCGSIVLNEYFGNFLDYQTECVIYLPYIGFRSINVNSFMSGSIHLYYIIDLLDGTCVAFVKAKRERFESIILSAVGNIYYRISLTAENNMQIINSIISAGLNVASPSKNPIGQASSLASSAMNIVNAQSEIDAIGNLSVNSGFLSVQTPYVMLMRPIQSMSAGFQKDKGYTSNIYSKLGNLHGYTEIEYINLSDIDCTQDERDRLMSILKSGFYI